MSQHIVLAVLNNSPLSHSNINSTLSESSFNHRYIAPVLTNMSKTLFQSKHDLFSLTQKPIAETDFIIRTISKKKKKKTSSQDRTDLRSFYSETHLVQSVKREMPGIKWHLPETVTKPEVP